MRRRGAGEVLAVVVPAGFPDRSWILPRRPEQALASPPSEWAPPSFERRKGGVEVGSGRRHVTYTDFDRTPTVFDPTVARGKIMSRQMIFWIDPYSVSGRDGISAPEPKLSEVRATCRLLNPLGF